MPQITQAWVNSFNRQTLDRVIALQLYYQQAVVLDYHTNDWTKRLRTEADHSKKGEIVALFLGPYYRMFVAMVYVVDEGLVALQIEDTKLQKARAGLDMNLLRRFRNATFHYQPQFRSPKIYDITTKNIGAMSALWERHCVLIRRLGRFINKAPHLDPIMKRMDEEWHNRVPPVSP